MFNLCSGKPQHFRQVEPGRIPAGVGQREALHPGHRSGTFFPQQSKTPQHPQGRSILMGPARSQVK